MKLLATIKTIVCKSSLTRYLPDVTQKRWLKLTLPIYNTVQIDFTKANIRKNTSEDKDIENVYNDAEESISDLVEYIDIFQNQEMPVTVRNKLYATPVDHLMVKLNSSGSVQELFDLLRNNNSIVRHEHIAQSVLILWDLQKMFYHVNLMNNTLKNQSIIITDLAENYYKKLNEHPDFKSLLQRIEQNCDRYNNDTLAIILLYLNSVGMDLNTNTIQMLIGKFNETKSDVSIAGLSRFTTILFRNPDLSSYYYVKDYIPTIFNYIENSKTVEEFKQCTVCLNNLNKLITTDVMDRYTQMLRCHLKSGFIDASDPKTILAIIMFLNYPQWRDINTPLLTEVILLMKDRIHLLNSYELLLLYEVFYKIQEPAVLLNELQRHASRHLAVFEEEAQPLLDVRLRLLLGLVAHSSRSQRVHYVRVLKRHAAYHFNRTSIFLFYKLLVYSKIGDADINRKLWSTVVHLLESDAVFRDRSLLRTCTSYLHYTQNIDGYRFHRLEEVVNVLLERELLDGYVTMYPARFMCAAAFIIAFGRNKQMLGAVVQQLEKYRDRLTHVDCLNQTRALQFAKDINNPILSKDYADRIQNALTTAIQSNIRDDMHISTNNVLLKCYIYNADAMDSCCNEAAVAQLIDKCSERSHLSSRIIKNLAFCLQATQSLVPQLLDDMAQYVVDGRDNVIGFNAEKVLHLCYHLGYQPRNSEQFFRATTEIILRDQERFSGLSYLQCCLALCYFQSLPNSFIKQIFNAIFLDTLDNELTNCYHKDTYPMRVRHLMMQLNRAVCIDCPEMNVPWFHQKYSDEILKKANRRYNDNMTQTLIQSYLDRILPGSGYLQQNVITPYGYYVDFALNVDDEDQFIRIADITEGMRIKKIALLLLTSNDFTKAQVQLMGKTALKIRHLEVLGYKVVLVDIPTWKNIISGFEKLSYLRRLLNVPNSHESKTTNL